MSHVGMTIVRHVASPNLIVQDSLDFGKVRLTHCTTRWLHIRNEGEAPLKIDSTLFSPHNFSLIAGDTIIAGYTTDSIQVQFCPDTAGRFSGKLLLYTND